jgi:hypothetical protein
MDNIAWFCCSKYDGKILKEYLNKSIQKGDNFIKLDNFEYDIENNSVRIVSDDWKVYCKSQKELEMMYIKEMFHHLRVKFPGRFFIR